MNNLRKILITFGLLLVVTAAVGTQNSYSPDREHDRDSILLSNGFFADNRPKPDTASLSDSVSRTFDLYNMVRGYKDSIVIRWMPSEYVPFRYGTEYGYLIGRTHFEGDSLYEEVLDSCLKPLSIEEFRHLVNPAAPAVQPGESPTPVEIVDSMAAAAAQTVYGRSVSMDQTQAAPGTMGSIMEVYEQQQQLFGYAAFVADMRPDLAMAMGLGYVDKKVRPGIEYTYHVIPLTPDSIIAIRTFMQDAVKLGSYKPTPFNVEMVDSITPPAKVTLMWPETRYSAYDIERRQIMKDGRTTEWKKLNDKPYVFMEPNNVNDDDGTSGINFYVDNFVDCGTYDYRLRAYDAFGDRTAPSHSHRVSVPDLIGPCAPIIDRIELIRHDKGIDARLTFTTDTIDDDMVGFLPYYNNPKIMDKEWVPMMKEPLAPGDTVCVVNVTGIETGNICVAAVDTAGNVTYSMPMPIHITDLKAPDAPTNLRYTIDDATGTVRLAWDAPADGDIDHYQIYTCNDLSHPFIPMPGLGTMNDTVYVDTLSTSVNQKYVYYKVSAVDFSTNEGPCTDVLEVLRPSLVKPQVAHLDSAYQDNTGIHMSWIVTEDVQAVSHKLFRRLTGNKIWDVLGEYSADSLSAVGYRLDYTDFPPPARERYEYAMESYSRAGIPSGLSLVYSVKFRGYFRIPCPITLDGACLGGKSNETRLVWTVTGTLPQYDEWYYCIFRKGPEDSDFHFLLSVAPDETTFSDYLLGPGETAEYYVKVMMPGVGESAPSNTIKVHAPAEKK